MEGNKISEQFKEIKLKTHKKLKVKICIFTASDSLVSWTGSFQSLGARIGKHLSPLVSTLDSGRDGPVHTGL